MGSYINEKLYIEKILKDTANAGITECEWKNTLVIGDVHFGVKNNSQQWLRAQIDLFKKQIFPIIENAESLNISDIVFLGDMFDIRSATNTVTAVCVKDIVREMCSIAARHDVFIYIIAGNHDFFSPLEQHKSYSAYYAVFGHEFEEAHKNIQFIVTAPYYIRKFNRAGNTVMGRVALWPWYETENKESFIKNINYIYKENKAGNEPVRACYMHCDLPGACMDTDIRRAVKKCGVPMYSGHIHYITGDNSLNIYNLGACMQYNFQDADAERYIYIINEAKNAIVRIENTVTPKFSIIPETEMFDDAKIMERAECGFVEIEVLSSNIKKAKYNERLKEVQLMLSASETRVKIVAAAEKQGDECAAPMTDDINKYIENNIPGHLTRRFISIKETLNNNNKQ